jgi:hypothetical protein
MATTPKKKPARKTPGNPPESPWYSTPAAKRGRKPLTGTVADTTREALEAEAKKQGRPLSQVLEDAVLEYLARRKT